MFDLFYIVAAGAGFLIYRQITTPPPPQVDAEANKIRIAPEPRVVYRPLSKLLVQDRPSIVVKGKSQDQGWLGTPRYDVVDTATGVITPVYSTEPSSTMRLLQI